MPAVELYGGAMTASLPDGYDDASRFRQVPDHQEVFMCGTNGVCIIIELLSRKAEVADSAIAAFHWTELAKANEADAHEETTISSVSQRELPTPKGAIPIAEQTAIGLQRVAKFNEREAANDVLVAVGVRRLPPPYATDIMVSVSAPQSIADGSSEKKYVEATLSPIAVVETMQEVFQSLTVVDFGLFVEEP